MKIIQEPQKVTMECDLYKNGEYNLAEFLLPQCKIFFDVGARTDTYFCNINPLVKYYLFEPMKKQFNELVYKCNGMSNVQTYNFGFGDQNKKTKIYIDSGSIFKRKHPAFKDCDQQEDIEIRKLSDFCIENDIEYIDFIKMDVEGFEYNVLIGGGDIIKERTKFIQFEYGGTYLDAGKTLFDMFTFFKGWYVYLIEPNSLNLITNPIDDYQYSNYVASRIKL